MDARVAYDLANKNGKRVGFVYNADIGLRRVRSALARLKAGEQKIYNFSWLGDSISEGGVAGGGAVSDASGTNYFANGYVGRVRSALATKFGDVGTGYMASTYNNYYKYWTLTGTWTSTSNGTASQCKTTSTSGDTATFSFNGTGISIMMICATTNGGTFTASIDGGAAQSFDTSTANLASKEFKITGLAAGAHTLTLTSTVTAGKSIWLIGAYPIKGTAGIQINNTARWGSVVRDSVGTAATFNYPLYAEIDIFSPILTVVALTANDYTAQTPLSSYTADLQTIITRAKQYGDCLLVSVGLRTEAAAIPQSAYNNVQMQLSLQNDIAYIDLFNRWSGDGNYAKNTLGLLPSTESVHPNDYGHQDAATAILNVLLEPQS